LRVLVQGIGGGGRSESEGHTRDSSLSRRFHSGEEAQLAIRRGCGGPVSQLGMSSSAARPMHSASQPTLLPSALTRNRLTPRSAEACRRTGIEPAELLPVPQSAFQETGQPADVEKIRWERYEELRMDAYKTVRAERERIIKEGGLGSAASMSSLRAGQPSEAAAEDDGAQTALALERRMVEKIRKKQQGEIEQMLMFEIRAAQLNLEKADKVRQQQEADERAKREREARAAEAAEARRKLELERRDAEAEEEKLQRRRQREEMAREKRLVEEEEEAERQRMVRARPPPSPSRPTVRQSRPPARRRLRALPVTCPPRTVRRWSSRGGRRSVPSRQRCGGSASRS
jgi:hypothetical protein